ncbi:MAG: aminotransferase class V-fold PLP-dependent enzyme [Robiginitomaculum sp.]|nr:aminotransferase class V-fold PLP-dependent enzyme [Robiginitomaculum sp.]
MIPNQRDKFDMPEDVAYLNCAFMSPLMHSVVKAAEAGVAFKQNPWTYSGPDFFTYSEEYRGLAAQLINAPTDNIAIIPSASYGLQIAANNLPLSKGGEVLVIEDQFPSNIYPWQEKAKVCGGNIHTVMRPDDHDWTKAVLGGIGKNTEILALPATHWADGGYLDLEVIGDVARNVGAALVLDLTQSLGAMPFDIAKVRPDYMVAAGYKWLMGPYSLGFLYMDSKWLEGAPLEHNWMNRAGSEVFSRLVDYQDGFQAGARRFDMGEKSNPAQLMSASAALTQVLDWGVENIGKTLGARNRIIAGNARQLGLTVQPNKFRSPHYLGFGFPNGIPKGLAETLAAQNIFVSIRGSSVRVTPHLYNTGEDIERLMDVLRGEGK